MRPALIRRYAKMHLRLIARAPGKPLIASSALCSEALNISRETVRGGHQLTATPFFLSRETVCRTLLRISSAPAEEARWSQPPSIRYRDFRLNASAFAAAIFANSEALPRPREGLAEK